MFCSVGSVLVPGKCFEFREVFWILEVFCSVGSVLDSGKCFVVWDVFLDSGKCLEFREVFWTLARVFGFWEVFCIC